MARVPGMAKRIRGRSTHPQMRLRRNVDQWWLDQQELQAQEAVTMVIGDLLLLIAWGLVLLGSGFCFGLWYSEHVEDQIDREDERERARKGSQVPLDPPRGRRRSPH